MIIKKSDNNKRCISKGKRKGDIKKKRADEREKELSELKQKKKKINK